MEWRIGRLELIWWKKSEICGNEECCLENRKEDLSECWFVIGKDSWNCGCDRRSLWAGSDLRIGREIWNEMFGIRKRELGVEWFENGKWTLKNVDLKFEGRVRVEWFGNWMGQVHRNVRFCWESRKGDSENVVERAGRDLNAENDLNAEREVWSGLIWEQEGKRWSEMIQEQEWSIGEVRVEWIFGTGEMFEWQEKCWDFW